MDDFGSLFATYWWLLLPFLFTLGGAFSSFMRYQRTRAKIDLLKTYAAAGKEPPADLIRNLEREDQYNWDEENDGGQSGTGTAFLVFLFAGLGGVFAFEGYVGLLGMGEVAYFVALIMGVLAIAFLANAIFKGRG